MRVLDYPPEAFSEVEEKTRRMVAADVAAGLNDDAVFSRQINLAIAAARLAGSDESEVEVVASLARRITADVLAGCRGGNIG